MVPVVGGRSVPIKLRNSSTDGSVAVASLENLAKFDMLKPGIFQSIEKEA